MKFFKSISRNQYVNVKQLQLTRSGLFLQFHKSRKSGKYEYCLVYRDYIVGMVYKSESGYESELGFPPFHISCYITALVLDIMKCLACNDKDGVVEEVKDFVSHRPQERLVA
jgi:hypothetical protein